MEPRRSIDEIIDALKHPPKTRSGAEPVSLESYYKQWAEAAVEALVGAEAAMGQWQDVLARTRDELEDTQQRLINVEVAHAVTQHRTEQAGSVEVTQHWEFCPKEKTLQPYPLAVFNALQRTLVTLHSHPADELPEPYDSMATTLVVLQESIRFEAHPEELEERMEELREEKRLMDMADAEQAGSVEVTQQWTFHECKPEDIAAHRSVPEAEHDVLDSKEEVFATEIHARLLGLHRLLAARKVLRGLGAEHQHLLLAIRYNMDRHRERCGHGVKPLVDSDDVDSDTVIVPKGKKPKKRGR